MQQLAVIGGSGLEKLVVGKAKKVKTAFGVAFVLRGELGGKQFFFISRHGPKHEIPPHMINHRANLRALADLGATDIVSLCAAGSLSTGKYKVGDIVTARDLFKLSPGPTFFDFFKDGPMHTGMDAPYSPALIGKIQEAARLSGVAVKDGAVITDTSGPRYETKTEVLVLASFNVDLAGMTTVSEAILANELRRAGYPVQNATLAIVTNYGTGLVGVIDHAGVDAVVKKREKDVEGILYQLVRMA
ncbi:MAG: MTAP family purine nucleoside phosphorylase [Candidatus Micrarchaeia archaeon]|jgi:5'-methylthioadenosine phosphorylase